MKYAMMCVMMVCVSVLGYASDFTSSKAKKAETDFESAIKQAKIKYIRSLKSALKYALKDGDLEESNRINAKIKQLSSTISDEKNKKEPYYIGVWVGTNGDIVEFKADNILLFRGSDAPFEVKYRINNGVIEFNHKWHNGLLQFTKVNKTELKSNIKINRQLIVFTKQKKKK